MDFIKNLFSHFQKVDSKDQTTEDRVSHNINIDNIQEPTGIQELLTSQSSDEINDNFVKEFDVSPDNPKDTEKDDVRANNNDIISNSSLTSISSDTVNNNTAQNILREEPVLNLDEFFEAFNEISKIVDVNDNNEKDKLKEGETPAITNNTEIPMLKSDDFDKTSIDVSKNVDVNDRNESDQFKGNNTNNSNNIDEPLLNLNGCDKALSKVVTVKENPTDNNKDTNFDNFDTTLSDFSKTVDSNQNKENLTLEEPLLILDTICSYEDVVNCIDADESKNVLSENKDTEPIRVVDKNMDDKTVSEIYFGEFEDILKCFDNKTAEKERDVESPQLPNLDETIEETNNTYASMTEVPATNNINLTQLEVEHNLNINTRNNLDTNEFQPEITNDELTMPNYVDFEADLVKCVIFKGNNSETIKTVKEHQPIVLDESEQANGLFDINENILFEDVIDLNDSMSNDSTKAGASMDIISISSTENEPNDSKNNDSNDCSGYNSSDFEFIDEEEAKLGGLVINCYNQKLGTPKRSKTVHTLEIAKDPSYVSGSSPESIELHNRSRPGNARDNPQGNRSGPSNVRDNSQDNKSGPSNARDNSQKGNRPGSSTAIDNCQKDYRPGPSNGRDNSQDYRSDPSNARDNSQDYGSGPRNARNNSQDNRSGPSNALHNYQHYRNVYFNPIDTNYRQNHVVPEGEEYNNLFQGIYGPFVSELFFLENKSIRPVSCMNVQFRHLGFDTIGVRREEESDNEYTDEANENAKKIISMYPGMNRKRRRRF